MGRIIGVAKRTDDPGSLFRIGKKCNLWYTGVATIAHVNQAGFQEVFNTNVAKK